MKKQAITAICGLCLSAALAGPIGAQVRVYVHDGPPVPRREVIPPPRAGYEWHGGYYRYEHNRYVWAPGEYVAVHPGHTWVPGHWDRGPGGHYWVEGHWV